MYSKSEILKSCKKLNEYTMLVEFIKQERQNFSENAIENAISKAIQQGILTEYLERKGSEVRNMFMVEYNYEEDIACRCAEAREEGLAVGAQNAKLDAARKAIADGKLTLQEISDYLDLPLATVQELAKELQK